VRCSLRIRWKRCASSTLPRNTKALAALDRLKAEHVTPAVRQEMPQWTFALASSFYEPSLRAVVEVEIDALGDVVSADVLQSSHPQYNAVLAKAALGWKYEPAKRNGQATKTRLRVDVVLKPR